MIKLKLSKPIIRLLYKFIDVEISGNMAIVDDRVIEYSYALSRVIQNCKPKSKILDVGCVARLNPIPETLCELGHEVIGIDTRVFNYQHPNFKFVQDSILTYNTKDCFDCVTLVSTLEHIGIKGRYGIIKNYDYADYHTIQNIRRILENDGKLILTVPFAQFGDRCGIHRIYDDDNINKLFSDGYEIIERKYYERDNDVLFCKNKSTSKSNLICLTAKKVF
jgi:SAM-dependent methyltransferase